MTGETKVKNKKGNQGMFLKQRKNTIILPDIILLILFNMLSSLVMIQI